MADNKPTQFSIDVGVKARLDKLKVERREDILLKYKKKKRMVTNTDAVRFLLDNYEARRKVR